MLEFAWDESKNKWNQHKHGLTFNEASTAFYDENAKEFFDPDHSDEEERFILLGMSQKARILVVCYCYRSEESIIRIISSRKANKLEQKAYLEINL